MWKETVLSRCKTNNVATRGLAKLDLVLSRPVWCRNTYKRLFEVQPTAVSVAVQCRRSPPAVKHILQYEILYRLTSTVYR